VIQVHNEKKLKDCKFKSLSVHTLCTCGLIAG